MYLKLSPQVFPLSCLNKRLASASYLNWFWSFCSLSNKASPLQKSCPSVNRRPYPIWFSATVHRVEPAPSQDRYSWNTFSIANLSMLLSLKFVQCRAQVLVKHFNGIHARSISLIHWIVVTLGIGNCALRSYCLVVTQAYNCGEFLMHKCPMTNCPSKLYLIRYRLHDRFLKRIEVYGLFSNGAIIAYRD